MNKAVLKQAIKQATVMDRGVFDYEFREMAEARYLEPIVISEGPLDAKVALFGEGLGEQEVKQKRPFIGGSGHLLWECLRPYGFSRDSVYASNIVKRQISLSRKGNKRHEVSADELSQWIELFNWELEQLPNLEIIFVLGGTAFQAITGRTGILNWRGSVIDWELPHGRKVKLVISTNPAYSQRELSMEPVFRQDCHKLHLVHANKFKPYHLEAIINPTYKEAMAFLRDLQRKNDPISLDVEHISGETAAWGLANDPHKAMCIAMRSMYENVYSLSQEADIMCAIQKLCDSHKIVAQNGAHEIYWTWIHDRIKIKVWFDTLLGHHLLYPKLPHNLGFQTTQYTTHPYYKDEFDAWEEGGNIDDFWTYNCKDAGITLYNQRKILTELQRQRLDTFFFDHVMRAQPHTASATVHGIAVDLSLKEIIVDQCQKDVDRLRDEFWRLVHELIPDMEYWPNPGSWQQMQQLYFDDLRLEGVGRSTDETNRYHMMNHDRTPPVAKEMLAAVGRWSTEQKFVSTFGRARVSPHDNRMRCDYKQYGVANAPGRLSSSSLIDDTGMNMQNQPARARSMYVADPGAVLLYFDLKQAEAQVVGYRANIPAWKAQFAQALKDGVYDCHRALASDMFKKPYDEVPKEDFLDEDGRSAKDPKCKHDTLEATIRYISKRCRHGLNYRMERFRLAEVTELPYHSASRAFALYHKTTPELMKWWEQEEREFRKNKVVFNAFGRPMPLQQRIDEDALKSIIAFYPQSTIGDKITRVWYQCEEDDDWPDPMHARIGIDVHDNLVALTMPKYAKSCLRVMKKWAEEPIQIVDAWGRKDEPLTIGADLKMSYPTIPDMDKRTGKLTFVENNAGMHRWSHMKEVRL